MVLNKTNDIVDKIIWCLTVLTLVLFNTTGLSPAGRYLIFVVLAVTFFMMVAFKNGTFTYKFGTYHKFTFVFILFCFCSVLWATYRDRALEKSVSVLEIVLLITVYYWYFSSKIDGVERLLKAVVWSGVLTSLYVFAFYGVSTLSKMVSESERIGSDINNVNSLGLAAAISIIILSGLVIFKMASRWYLLLLVPLVIMIAFSASRKALVIPIAAFFVLLLYKSISENNFVNFIKYLIIIAVSVVLLTQLLKLPIFSLVNERFNQMIADFTGNGKIDNSTWERQNYIKAGWQQFLKTPIFGIGISNSNIITVTVTGSNTYLHNNFIELLACGGIVGFLLFYDMYFYVFISIFKYRSFKKPLGAIILILAVAMLAVDYGAVSYYSKSTYFYLMILFVYVEKIKRERRYATYENN